MIERCLEADPRHRFPVGRWLRATLLVVGLAAVLVVAFVRTRTGGCP